MVKLTVDLISRGTSGYAKKKRDETMQHYLKRLTHLYLENKNLDSIGHELALCHNLMVLYLYENHLTSIPHLPANSFLTHLYLQNNRISDMRNLSFLVKLTKLYLGGNCLTVIEGIETLEKLTEFHVENQHLPPGEKLLFDPRSLKGIAPSLQVLNVSGNMLHHIEDFNCLTNLIQLTAADNQITDIKDVAAVLMKLSDLLQLDLSGNPICKKTKYRDKMIVMSKKLAVLDGKEISKTSKDFLCNWKANKEALRRRQSEMAKRGMTANTREGMDLPPLNMPLRHATVPSYIMPGLPRKQFTELLRRVSLQIQDDSVVQLKSTSRTSQARHPIPMAFVPPSTAPEKSSHVLHFREQTGNF